MEKRIVQTINQFNSTIDIIITTFKLPNEEVSTKGSRGGQHSIASSVNAGNRQLLTEIPHQVSNTVGRMEHEWVGHGSLGNELAYKRKRRSGRNNRGRRKGNIQERSCSVRHGDRVEGTAQDHSRDSVPSRQEPRQLGLVDVSEESPPSAACT